MFESLGAKVTPEPAGVRESGLVHKVGTIERGDFDPGVSDIDDEVQRDEG
jgi:hypothetical protein